MSVGNGIVLTVMEESYEYVYRTKGCTTLLVERAGWEGNEFRLWLPECVLAWKNWGPDPIQKWRETGKGKFEWRYSISVSDAAAPVEVDLVCSIRVDRDNECLWYSIAAANRAATACKDFQSATCLQLFNAPEFISIRGERLWVCLDGKWTTTDTVPRETSMDPRRVKFLREGLRKERTIIHSDGFPHSTMAEAACHPLFMAESRDGKKCVGIACDKLGYLFNNNDPVLRCIHSEPLAVADIPPGETAVANGVVLLCDGAHETMLERFDRIVPADWWRGGAALGR